MNIREAFMDDPADRLTSAIGITSGLLVGASLWLVLVDIWIYLG